MPVTALPASVPRAGDFEHFSADPLHFLAHARQTHGDLFAIRERGPVFSRAPGCTGVVAAFGAAHQRAVLSDPDTFCLPASAAYGLKLSPNLVNLNRGLHSMGGAQHADHKRLLATVLGDGVNEYGRLIWAALDDFAAAWTVGRTVRLLDQMRELTLQISSRVLFGHRYAERSRLALQMRHYFRLRREASSPANPSGTVSRRRLIAAGHALDGALRKYVRECRADGVPPSDGILATLAALPAEPQALSEDEIIGHSNVLFVSRTEPIAVALTWIILILSQLPALRAALRDELSARLDTSTVPTGRRLARLSLLDSVINESLRLLPPNAFMVRLTDRPTVLGTIALPEHCEIVLCPLVSHRDPACFSRPTEFLPERWSNATPSPFVYFPFGAGAHSCVGRSLAVYLIRTTLAFLLPRYDLVLAGDQDVDWRLHIIFMPSSDPQFEIRSPAASSRVQGGKLGGPVGEMLTLDRQCP